MPSYEQRNGKWSVRFRAVDGTTEINKRLSGYKTKKEAQKAYAEYITRSPSLKIDKKQSVEGSFREITREFLQSKKHNVKESSYIDMEVRIVKHILPFFGDMQIAEITVAQIEKWQEMLSEQGLAYKTKHNIRNYLNQIFNLAQRRYKIVSPMPDVEKFRNLTPDKEMQVYSEDEFALFLAAAQKDPIYHAFFHTLFVTGMRKGEALALTRQDIFDKQDFQSGKQDFETAKQYIRINKSLSFKTKNGTYNITTPKTRGSKREVYIPAALAEELRALPDNAFLFGINGKPLSENTITRKMKTFAKLAGIKEIRVHDLRHSHVSFLISKGVPITAISKRLGHATVTQTLSTYAHILPNDEERIENAVGSLV